MCSRIDELIEELKAELQDLSKVSTAQIVAELAKRFVIKPDYSDAIEVIDKISDSSYVAIDTTAEVITL